MVGGGGGNAPGGNGNNNNNNNNGGAGTAPRNNNNGNRAAAAAAAAAPAEGGPILDWEENDRFSFEDSDRFEEDSLCSWSSEPESICNNWRGWKKPVTTNTLCTSKKSSEGSYNT